MTQKIPSFLRDWDLFLHAFVDPFQANPSRKYFHFQRNSVSREDIDRNLSSRSEFRAWFEEKVGYANSHSRDQRKHLISRLWIYYSNVVSDSSPVRVRESSNCSGSGIVARIPLESERLLMELRGTAYPISAALREKMVAMGKDHSIFQSQERKDGSYVYRIIYGPFSLINHCCTQFNCEIVNMTDGSCCVRTIADVAKGEELFLFYSVDYFGQSNYKCQNRLCCG